MARATPKHWPSVADTLLYASRFDIDDMVTDAELVKQQVSRNLENLLNTRRSPIQPRSELGEVSNSVAMYGVPDFTSHGFDVEIQRNSLCNEIRRVIRNFEPRLKRVVVEDLNDSKNLTRLLRFKISADLQSYPVAHRVVFDSRLDRATSLFMVDKS